MWTSGFFNSVNGDRVYNAQQMSEIFEGLITDGVYEAVGNKLAVQPGGGMDVQIASGRGWFNKHWVNNETEYLINLEGADAVLNRYAAVGVRVDTSDGERSAIPFVTFSELADIPIKPEATRTDTIKEYILAYVYIKAGAASITEADIEDTRADNNLCGWVTGLIEQLDSGTLFAQWQAIFVDWFENLQDYMDADVEAKLVNDVTTLQKEVEELQGRCAKVSGTLSGSGWSKQSDGTYRQTITVAGITDDNDILVNPANECRDMYSDMGCIPVSQDVDSVTFSCTDPEDGDIVVCVIIFNLK